MTAPTVTLPPAYAEREAELRSFMERNWPDMLPDECHVLDYYVAHDQNGTWVMYSLYATRDERGRLVERASFQRFGCRASGWVEKLEDVPGHPHGEMTRHGYGVCPDCTKDWREAHGLGSDISDISDVWELPEGVQR